jgi:hypothetical protein
MVQVLRDGQMTWEPKLLLTLVKGLNLIIKKERKWEKMMMMMSMDTEMPLVVEELILTSG